MGAGFGGSVLMCCSPARDWESGTEGSEAALEKIPFQEAFAQRSIMQERGFAI